MRLDQFGSEPIPRRLATRPRDQRGLPIPFVVLVVNGKPDFRITDVERWAKVVNHRLCALCGEPLGARIAFIGGPQSHASHCFTDGPMHRDCAEYAIRVCPYLALRHMKRGGATVAPDGVMLKVVDEVSEERPERFFVGITTKYEVDLLLSGSAYLLAGEWESVAWFRHGEPVGPPEAAAAAPAPSPIS